MPHSNPLFIYAVSDATGELPINIAYAAARQFASEGIQIVRRAKIKDPALLSFWNDEFRRWEPRFRNEVVSPILNKIGQIVMTPMIRNIIGQPPGQQQWHLSEAFTTLDEDSPDIMLIYRKEFES